MNVITITGNIGADARLVTFQTGEATNFSVGVSDAVKNPDGTWGNKTIWYSCQLVNKNMLPYLTKGTSVLIQGSLLQSWVTMARHTLTSGCIPLKSWAVLAMTVTIAMKRCDWL